MKNKSTKLKTRHTPNLIRRVIKKTSVLLLHMLFSISTVSFAQTKKEIMTGTVYADDGTELPGANVLVKGTTLVVRKDCDLNRASVYQKKLKRAVELGLIEEEEIDRSLIRLILARMKLGMFGSSKNIPFTQIPYKVNNSSKHDEMSLKMAQKSMTLLQNIGILPLNKKKIKNIAIVMI